jgi:mono/diheme cytochrome c family protein
MAPNSSFYTLELSEIIYKVIYGGEGMPSFKNTLTTNEIEAVAYYIYKTK